MKFNPRLQADMAKYMDYVIFVEGKKDVKLLNDLGFETVFALHETGIPLAERVQQLKNKIPKRKKVCILTDLDKRGKKLYFQVKALCKEHGIKTDSTLRGILLVSDVSHLEEVEDFVKKASGEMKHKRKHWERR